MVISTDSGKDAYSKITLVKKFRDYSLVEIEIETEELIKSERIQHL